MIINLNSSLYRNTSYFLAKYSSGEKFAKSQVSKYEKVVLHSCKKNTLKKIISSSCLAFHFPHNLPHNLLDHRALHLPRGNHFHFPLVLSYPVNSLYVVGYVLLVPVKGFVMDCFIEHH